MVERLIRSNNSSNSSNNSKICIHGNDFEKDFGLPCLLQGPKTEACHVQVLLHHILVLRLSYAKQKLLPGPPVPQRRSAGE